MPEIIIYSSSICPYCIMAKKLFDRKNAKYKEINVDVNPELRQEMMAKAQRRTVPQIFIGDLHVGGFEELYALEQKKELDKLLV
jgi:glutaredoxin 3